MPWFIVAIVSLLAINAGIAAKNEEIVYRSSDGGLLFRATSDFAEFAPTDEAQANLRQRGLRPADSFGGDVIECSTRMVRCFGSENAGIVFAVRSRQSDKELPYEVDQWSFIPTCIIRKSAECVVSVVRFEHPVLNWGFFVFDINLGVVAFAFIDKKSGGVTQEFLLDRRSSTIGLLGQSPRTK